MKKEFDVTYFKQERGQPRTFSHKYHESWCLTELFCPRCGKQRVWMCESGADYYVGEQYVCCGCNGLFYLPSGVNDAIGEQDKQRLEGLEGL